MENIRRPPLEGPPGCGEPVRSPAIWYPAFLSILLALQLYILYILCLLSILLLSVCSVVLAPTDRPFTTHFRGREILGSTPHVQESIQIQRIHQYCTYSHKATPRYQKRLQKVSTSMPKIIEISKKAKIRNLTKTTVFTMFLRVAGIRNQQFLQSKIIKNRACNPNMLFDTSTHIKYQKVRQKWSQSGILNSSKIDTNLHWDAQEPS